MMELDRAVIIRYHLYSSAQIQSPSGEVLGTYQDDYDEHHYIRFVTTGNAEDHALVAWLNTCCNRFCYDFKEYATRKEVGLAVMANQVKTCNDIELLDDIAESYSNDMAKCLPFSEAPCVAGQDLDSIIKPLRHRGSTAGQILRELITQQRKEKR